MHENANYELEKIRCNLNIETPQINQDFGLSCAKSFYEQFANKWVDIDVDNMDYKEIKLLVNIACYLGKQEECNNATPLTSN